MSVLSSIEPRHGRADDSSGAVPAHQRMSGWFPVEIGRHGQDPLTKRLRRWRPVVRCYYSRDNRTDMFNGPIKITFDILTGMMVCPIAHAAHRQEWNGLLPAHLRDRAALHVHGVGMEAIT